MELLSLYTFHVFDKQDERTDDVAIHGMIARGKAEVLRTDGS